MASIFDQPAANKISVKNYNHSVENGISILDPHFRSNFSEEELNILEPYSDQNGILRYWGVAAGESNQTANKWMRITPGDIALFYFGKHRTDGYTSAYAKILGKIHSPKLAQFTWSPKKTANGLTQDFEYIYFVKNPILFNLDVRKFNDASGRASLKTIREFNSPQDETIRINRFDALTEILESQGVATPENDSQQDSLQLLEDLSQATTLDAADHILNDQDSSSTQPEFTDGEQALVALTQIIDAEVDKPVARERAQRIINQIVRNARVTSIVLNAYNRICQICRIPLESPNGNIAEGAHIRALGGEHQGQDLANNMLCLCPSCHRAFDKNAIMIQDDYSIMRWDEEANDFLFSAERLFVHEAHHLNIENIKYHRNWVLSSIV